MGIALSNTVIPIALGVTWLEGGPTDELGAVLLFYGLIVGPSEPVNENETLSF